MNKQIQSRDYLTLLEGWLRSAEEDLYTPPDRPDLLCYGTGYDHWGVQTNQKAMATYAVLAADPAFDPDRAGYSREVVREKALKLLRFSLASHLEGDYHCLDGRRWGHTWISVLGLERMMHGVEAIRNYLHDDDEKLLRRVLLSEADWLTDKYEIRAGLVENNRPESNLWNGCFLHRVAALYPDAPGVKKYQEKGTAFLLNGLSLPSDGLSEEVVSGRKLKEWFVGANFFQSLALNHHGYLNVGYMVICLSQVALLHFFCRTSGLNPPEALYRHAAELWALVKTFTFPDGRLLRIGGDTRIRYCYCQDYAVPVWLFAADYLGDEEAVSYEGHWLKTLATEVAAGGDGSFLRARLRGLRTVSPLYYTRLEADRAVSLSMGAYWRRVLKIKGWKKIAGLSQWADAYHGACFQKGEKRIVSFCWQAAQPPQLLCLPSAGSTFAEWRENLAGRVFSLARYHRQEVLQHQEIVFSGGFLVIGQTRIQASSFIAEGQIDLPVSQGWLVAAALPDDRTVVVMQKQVACHSQHLSRVQGLLLNVPNDIFNHCRRVYYAEREKLKLRGASGQERIVRFNSSWVNVDDCLGLAVVYGCSSLSVYQSGRRQAGLGLGQYEAAVIETGLAVDELCAPCWFTPCRVKEGDLLYDVGAVVQVNVSHQETARHTATGVKVFSGLPAGVKGLKVLGGDLCWYLLVVNTGEEIRLSLQNFHRGKAVSLTEDQPLKTLALKTGQGCLLRLEE